MMEHDGLDRCATPQMMEAFATENSNNDELTTSPSSGERQVNPWPAIRRAVHAYARHPTEEHMLAVGISMRHLRQQRDFAQSR